MDKFIVDEWINFSKIDLAAAKHLNDTMQPRPYTIICYHCQQSAEKIMKAYLIYKDADPPKTHDLELLRKKCEFWEDSFIRIFMECVRLNPYSSQLRYPSTSELSEEISNIAIDDGMKVFNFTKNRIA